MTNYGGIIDIEVNAMNQNLNNIKIQVTDNFDMIWRYADGYLEAGNILLNLLIDPKRYDFYPYNNICEGNYKEIPEGA